MVKLVNDGSLRIQNLSAVEIERIEPLDLAMLFRRIWQGKWLIGLFVAAAIWAGGYYAFAVATPQFAATATLQVTAAKGPLPDLEQVVAGQATDTASINTEVAILQSRHLLEKVVQDLALLEDPEFNRYLTPAATFSLAGLRSRLRNLVTGQTESTPDAVAILEKTIQNLSAVITAGTQRDTYIYRIRATTGSVEKSVLIANTLARAYLADQVAAKFAASENAVTWLSDRVYELQMQLEESETAVNDVIASQQVGDAATLDALSRQAADAAQRHTGALRALSEAKDRLQRAEAGPIAVAATGQQTRAQLSAEVARQTAQAAALSDFHRDILARLSGQSAAIVRLQQLRREAEATRVLYETFLARLQETSIRRGLQTADSRILSAATTGTYVAPRKALILLVAALLGAAAGTAVVLGRHMLHRGVTTAEALEAATGLPVFAQLPRMPIRDRRQLLDYLNAKPTSAAAESIRNLRTSLLLADKDRAPQVILSTSSISGEGKTTQSIALAHNLARLGKTVLLVEADLRQGPFAAYFSAQRADLGRIIAGQQDLALAIHHDPQLGADVLMGALHGRNPADLFSDPQFAAFIAGLRTRYDAIILDAPPVLPVPDARLLAQHSDAVLYTVRWEKTPARLVQAGKRALEGVNVPISGLVMSQVDGRKMRQYGEGSFASYGHPYYQN